MSNSVVGAISVVLTLPLLAAAREPAPSTGQPSKEVVAAIRGRLDAVARNDLAEWARFVADDMTAPLGGTKQAWLATHKAWPREVTYWYGPLRDVKVQIHGDTAVATYHSDQFTKVGEQTTSVHRWQIETLVHEGDRWLLLAVADGVLMPEPKAVKVAPAVLDAYVGEYQWAPTLVSRIERQGDALLERFAGSDPSELSPENETTFFIKGEAAGGDSSRLIFVKDASGRVTHYIYRALGATDRVVKKIK